MYTALCPNCGYAMYRANGGTQKIICAQCQQMSSVTFHFAPGKLNLNPYGGGPLGFQPYPPMAPITSANPLGPDEAEPDPLEARRAALGQRLYGLATTVAEMLRTVDTEDWDMPANAAAYGRYERLQEAHAALYVALGGARMGDYHPARATLDEALADVLLWALLTLDAVER